MRAVACRGNGCINSLMLVRSIVWLCLLLVTACSADRRGGDLVDAATDAATEPDATQSGGSKPGDPCLKDQLQCDGLDRLECIEGRFAVAETCEDGCTAGLGCTACSPSEASCDGDVSTYCANDGSEFRQEHCDEVKGLTCSGASGRCEGLCSLRALGRSYVGCEYFAIQSTNTSGDIFINPDNTSKGLRYDVFKFAVVLANTTDRAGMVTIDGGALDAPRTTAIDAQGVVIEELPWVEEATHTGPHKVARGAYRIRSDVPLSAYQFSPLHYKSGDSLSYSNDASLLLPSNVYGKEYRVLGFPGLRREFNVSPATLSVVALHDGTGLAIESGSNLQTGSAPINKPPGFESLNAGDVVQFTSNSDFSGAKVTATQPVAVLSGHEGTFVPEDIGAVDHLEESMFPLGTVGKEYVVVSPAVPNLPEGKVRVVRILSTEPETTLEYSADVGGPAVITLEGDYTELPLSADDFVVKANKPIVVAQFMAGQLAGGGAGDPSMTVEVPVEQYRKEYLFHAPLNYEVSYANIVRPAGVEVMLDGSLVTGFTAVGDGAYEVTRAKLATTSNGSHRLVAAEPVGVSVYGYGQFTSYWYPAGLDLELISIR